MQSGNKIEQYINASVLNGNKFKKNQKYDVDIKRFAIMSFSQFLIVTKLIKMFNSLISVKFDIFGNSQIQIQNNRFELFSIYYWAIGIHDTRQINMINKIRFM